MRRTGRGLAKFALGRLKTPYFYGAKITHGVLTESFMEEMHRKFPELVDEAYLEKARKRKQVGKVNVDCSGLIGAYRGMERATTQLYATAKLRIPIKEIENFPVGTVLWKPGHVGVYVGKKENISYCVEAKGIDYGTIISKVEETDWKMGLLFPDMRYASSRNLTGSRKGENPYMKPVFSVMSRPCARKYREQKTVSYGEGVRWLQWELKEAGYELAVDGIFGTETFKRLIDFQTSCELFPDGIAGTITKEYLTVSL